MAMNGKITLVSNKDKGTCKRVTIESGMTAKEVIYAHMGAIDSKEFAVTVQGVTVKDPSKYKLRDGDLVVISPTNVKGN